MIRVCPPKELERTVIEPLLEQGFFVTKYKAMAFAGALGFYYKRRERLTQRGEGIRIEYFQSGGDAPVIDIIALGSQKLVTTDDLQLMAEERSKERVTIFEEYAHGGLKKILEVCFEESDSILDGLMQLYDELEQGANPDANSDWDKEIFGDR